MLTKQQHPARQDVINALQIAVNGHWESKAYFQFVDSSNANQSDASWQFKENIILEDSELGTIVLDLLKDGQIGGIEFIKMLD